MFYIDCFLFENLSFTRKLSFPVTYSLYSLHITGQKRRLLVGRLSCQCQSEIFSGLTMAFSFLKKSTIPQVKIDKAPAEGIEAFKKFYDAETLEEILESFEQVCVCANIGKGGRFIEFFPYLKAAYLVKADI